MEDSEDIRDSLRDLLEDVGHEVHIAKDGLEGSVQLSKLRPEIAVVDLGLPGIDGYEVARRARAQRGGDQICLVALTGYGGPEAKSKALSAGFDLHLTKPVDVGELLEVVGRTSGTATFGQVTNTAT